MAQAGHLQLHGVSQPPGLQPRPLARPRTLPGPGVAPGSPGGGEGGEEDPAQQHLIIIVNCQDLTSRSMAKVSMKLYVKKSTIYVEYKSCSKFQNDICLSCLKRDLEKLTRIFL